MYLVFVAVHAEVVAMGLVTVGVTLWVSHCWHHSDSSTH